jgi:hypothetical protein
MKNHALFVTQSATDANAPATRGVAVSSTNTYYSKKVSGSNYLSGQMAWTGTPTGTFTVWGSDKAEPNEATDADWFSITPTQAPANPAGAAAGTSFRVNEFNCKWKRVKYVNASGSGVLSGDASVGEQF